eukprot:COSAG04_NODE_30_length_35898_cov_42.288053_26_plen_102_part_00
MGVQALPDLRELTLDFNDVHSSGALAVAHATVRPPSPYRTLLFSCCSTLRPNTVFMSLRDACCGWAQVAAAPKLERLGLNGNTISAAVTPPPQAFSHPPYM